MYILRFTQPAIHSSPQLKQVTPQKSQTKVLTMGQEKSHQCLLVKPISRMTVTVGLYTVTRIVKKNNVFEPIVVVVNDPTR
jgi:hypothetical protein